jgi:hypothetical protein
MFGTVFTIALVCGKYNDCSAPNNPGMMTNNVFLMLCTGLGALWLARVHPKLPGACVDATAAGGIISQYPRKSCSRPCDTEPMCSLLNPETCVRARTSGDVLSNAPAPRYHQTSTVASSRFRGTCVSFSLFPRWPWAILEASYFATHATEPTRSLNDSMKCSQAHRQVYEKKACDPPSCGPPARVVSGCLRVPYRIPHTTRELNVWNPLSGAKEVALKLNPRTF